MLLWYTPPKFENVFHDYIYIKNIKEFEVLWPGTSKSHYDIPISFIFSNTYENHWQILERIQVFHATINLMWTAFPWKPWKNNLTIFFSLFLSPCRYHGVSLGDFDGGRYLHGKMDGIWRFLLLGLYQSLSRRLRGHLQLTGNKDQQQSGGMPEEGM